MTAVKQALSELRLAEPVSHEGLTVHPLIRASLPTSIEIRKRMEAPQGVVRMDATQIQQVLLNLCANAAHAMEKNGGVLEIQLRDQAILCKGFSSLLTELRAREIGISAYLTKPLSIHELGRTVRKVLDAGAATRTTDTPTPM